MKKMLLLCALVLGLAIADPALAATKTLSWTDNSSNETDFRIERTTAATEAACQTATGFAEIGSTPANVTTFDVNIPEGATHCFRVRAANGTVFSGYSNIVGRTIPLGSPSNLVISP